MLTNSNYTKMVGERSTSEQRGPSVLAKPIRPSPFSGSYRAVSAEDKHVHSSWIFNNSPKVLNNLSKNHRNIPGSNNTSLSSSALSIDEQFSGGLNMKSFEKFAHMGQPHVIALYNFETGVDGDLEFEVGDIIMLEDIVDESWYKGRSIRTGAVGIFPMNHVEVRIPLTSGLFTDTQPKMDVGYSNRSKNITSTTRTYSHPSFKKKPVPLPKVINQSAPRYINHDCTLCRQSFPCCNLPKRPSRIRVASLKAKHELCSPNSTESLDSQTINSSTNLKRVRSNYTNMESKVSSDPLNKNLPVDNLLPNRLPFNTKHALTTTVKPSNPPPIEAQLPPMSPLLPPQLPLEQTQQLKPCNTPPVINSLKPRNQTAISQMAQLLQEKGIVSYRNRQMPSGAKHLYPGSHPLLISSAPSSSDRLKLFTETNTVNIRKDNNNTNVNENNNSEGKNNHNVKEKTYESKTDNNNNNNNVGNGMIMNGDDGKEEQSSVKTGKYHSPLMVETVLSKLLPELNLLSNGSSDSSSIIKTLNNRQSVNSRSGNSKKIDIERRHSTESSFSNDSKNSTENYTINHHLSSISNHVKKSKESNMLNGVKTNKGEQSVNANPTTIVRNAKLLHSNSFSSVNNKYEDNNYIKRAFTVSKPPEKLVTSKVYIHLSPSSAKSPDGNQLSTTIAKKAIKNTMCDQKFPRSTSNHQYSLIDPSAETNHSKMITPNDWLIVEHEQLGNELTGEFHLTVGNILKCIDSNPKVYDNSYSDNSMSSSTNGKWVKCENWFGVTGLVKTSCVRVIDNPNELANYLEARPRVKALYTFDQETDEDLPLSPGEIVYLFEAIDENWYRGESAHTGNRGMFPATFVEIIKPL
ncbi:Endophilin-A2 isoform 1 [Schistosoma japonicum]|uniref:Endophilin-A2 isoform 1 n=2 Tax=Schistosoma japonicum TaxID=6182 RepID=A0A4Z2DD99_SCHJA|nr:Endophilin-A2 isoform 1 [Schistosoma japonicum]